MKKLKILPSILMLVLCVGVLAVGVFAITPTTNTISGQIEINPTNTAVKIELLKDGTSIKTFEEVRTGISWNVNELATEGNSTLTFESNGKNFVYEVSKIKLTLRVTNLSETQTIGAFFEDEALVANADGTYPLAQAKNVKGDHQLLAKEDGTSVVADVYISTYTPIKPAETMDMNIVLSAHDFYSTLKTADISYKLIIEKYASNYETEKASNFANDSVALLKFPTTGMTALPADGELSSISKLIYVAIPSNITSIPEGDSIGDTPFISCSNLKGISLPNSFSDLGMHVFASCAGLKSLDLSHTSLNALENNTGIGYISLPDNFSLYGAVYHGSINVPNAENFLNTNQSDADQDFHLYENNVYITSLDRRPQFN